MKNYKSTTKVLHWYIQTKISNWIFLNRCSFGKKTKAKCVTAVYNNFFQT